MSKLRLFAQRSSITVLVNQKSLLKSLVPIILLIGTECWGKKPNLVKDIVYGAGMLPDGDQACQLLFWTPLPGSAVLVYPPWFIRDPTFLPGTLCSARS